MQPSSEVLSDLQVLGGAGPAIAAVPLTVVWVGGSFVTLLTGISAGKVGPVGAAQRIGYVFFMSVAQVSYLPFYAILLTHAPHQPAILTTLPCPRTCTFDLSQSLRADG